MTKEKIIEILEGFKRDSGYCCRASYEEFVNERVNSLLDDIIDFIKREPDDDWIKCTENKNTKGAVNMENKYYIIRGESAGVFAGNIKERNGSEVTLVNARRLWYWDGAASLSQLAVEGVKRPDNCKFTVTVPEITILGVIEIIPCTDAAEKCIKEVQEWRI